MEILVIANPASGRGKGRKRVNEFVRLLERRGHKVEVYFTTKWGDAMERARNVAAHFERLVVAGGDGTINQVLNGLVDPLRTPLVHLATGTANQLHRDLQLPSGISALVDVVENGRIIHADMGLIGRRRFLNLVSAGFDAMVTEQLRKRRPKRLGYSGYLVPIARAVREYKPIQLRINVDQGETVTGDLAIVLNVRSYGGYFIFSERAELDSGFFEVVVIPHGGIPVLFKYAIFALLGRMQRSSEIMRLKGRHVRIESDGPAPVQVDGDYYGTTPIEAVLVPASVALIAPRQCDMNG